MSNIGENLKTVRKSKGILQRDIAKLLGVPLRTYQSYEYGEADPSLDSVARLAEYLDVSTDFLLGRKNYWTDSEGNVKTLAPADILNLDTDKLKEQLGKE